LFSDRSILTMIHGIVLFGGFLVIFSSVAYGLWNLRLADGASALALQRQSRLVARGAVTLAVILWLIVLIGTFINFPPYKAVPPAGTTDLSAYPKELLKSDPNTAWLHEYGMELKEHMPWIPAMLMTVVAFIAVRYGARLANERTIRNTLLALMSISFAVAGFTGLMGVLINKVAPLQ
jgi:hypothetical protein